MISRRQFAATLAAAAASLAAATARADTYPDRPITMIVPFGPGGGVSINARALAPYLEKQLGQTIIIDNREGAGGIIGHTMGAFARPDGYTLTMVSPGITAAPWLVPNVRFTPDDYTYIGQVTFVPNMVVVNADSPWQGVKDLVAAMKADPGKIATGGISGWPSSTVAQALFLKAADVTAKVVPGFKGGADMISAVLGKHIDFGFVNLNEAMPLYEAHRIRILAVSAPARAAALPDVPTFREQGIDVTTGVWRSLAAPKGTPQPIIDRLSAALKAALADPALKQDFDKVELSVDYLDAEETRKRVLAEYQAFGRLFTELHMNVRKS
ncbi:MAG: tripartite tricarboxylate transporter substrate binding protein [Acidisphaera sp.]|nr:tripartite tricarboxylate transporter substrate binding protein [Acidisphaera sp.]